MEGWGRMEERKDGNGGEGSASNLPIFQSSNPTLYGRLPSGLPNAWAYYLGTFFYWAALYVYVPILSVYTESLGASFTMVGMVVGAYGFVQMLLRIPLGIWSDQLGRRKLFLFAGHFFNFLGCFGLGLAQNPTHLIVFRGVLGVSAATWVVFTVLYASYFPPDQTPKAMGVVTSINGISLIIVNVLCGWIAEIWGMRVTFFVGAGFAVLGLVSTMAIKEHRVAREPLALERILRVASRPTLLITASITALTQYAFWATTFSFIPLYADKLGASKFTLGIIGTIALVPYTFASLVNHRLGERLGENRAVFIGALVMAAMAYVVPLIPQPNGAHSTGTVAAGASLSNLIQRHAVSLLAISQGVSGFGRGMVQPLLMGLSIRETPSEDRATAMGVYQAIYAIGMFTGPITAGAIADTFALSGAFIIAGTISVVAALAALSLLSR